MRMVGRRVEGGKGRQYSNIDPREVQRLNHEADVLFGKEHPFELIYIAPMPLPETYQFNSFIVLTSTGPYTYIHVQTITSIYILNTHIIIIV